MFFLQDYANLIFLIGLCFAGFIFWLRRFIHRNSCIIAENTSEKLEFWLKPVDLYRFSPIVASIGAFFLFAILYIMVHPNFARLTCQDNTRNLHDISHFECEYLEQNYSGLTSRISFDRIDKIELNSKREDTYFPLYFVLTVSQIKGDSYPLSRIKQLQRLITNFYRITRSRTKFAYRSYLFSH